MTDINEAYDMWQEHQEKMLRKRPRCCMCGEHIQTEYFFRIYGDFYCEDCIEDCKEETENFDD